MPATVRLLTSNVLMGRADPVAFGHLLDRIDPDVVVLQELGHNLVTVLEDRFSNHWLEPSDDFVGRGVATRLDAVFGTIDMPLRSATTAELQVGGETWRMAGVHLANPIAWPPWRFVRTRTLQLDMLEGWLGTLPKGPVLVAGDFNASPAWPAYRRVVESLDDVAAPHSPGPTWGWRPGWPAMLRIDHVFARGLRATGASVHQIAGSDHRAVVVELLRDENGIE